jgi:sugar/nucleoside kinase (ribokinase family)
MTLKDRYVVTAGTACIDEYYKAQCWPEEGNKGLIEKTGEMVGGMIANAACVFAGYGVKTFFFDMLNSGKVTEYILKDLEGYGVDVSPVVFNDALPDAKTIITLTPGERTILVVDGHKPEVRLEGERLELFRNSSYVYTTISEFRRFKDSLELAGDLKKHGVNIVFDIEASTFDTEDTELLKCADILFFNDFGFKKFCAGTDAETCFQSLFNSGVKIVTVTLGKEGSYTRTPAEEDRTKAIPFEAVDTTGAGDTFNSSFISSLLMGRDIHGAAKFANTAASLSITKLGPKGGVSDTAAIETLMKKYYED